MKADPRPQIARPEIELLLSCSRTHVGQQTGDRIKLLLRQEIDWPFLVRTAVRHGMVPLLYWNLERNGLEAVPEPIRGRLRNHFYANASANLRSSRELFRLIALFTDHGILAVPFKGLALAEVVYGNVVLRQVGDLDILVRKQDLFRVKDLLTTSGYRIELTERQQKYYFKHKAHFEFMKEDGTTSAEIHWTFLPRYWSFSLNLDDLAERLQKVTTTHGTMLSFQPEDLLVILCAHGCKHFWSHLKWICDVAELLRHYQGLDWGRVSQQAADLGATRMLFLGILLATGLLGADVPVGILRQARADRLAQVLARQISESFRSRGVLRTSMDGNVLYFVTRERIRDKVPFLLYYLCRPSERDKNLVSLPRRLYRFYYFLRPIRLCAHCIANPGRVYSLARHFFLRARPPGT